MKTKTILQTLALAMLMPMMLLTTACSNSDDEIINTENPANAKGYTLPATINVTRQGDATTRATYDGETKMLSFSAGDKLFVQGFYDEDNLYDFAGVLTWQPGDTFSGTIYLEGPFEGTAEELLSSALGANATLLPAGYGGYGFLSIDNEGTCDASLNLDRTKTFALTKATAVEQFSQESAEEYNNGFALSPERAIVCFTISGLEANKEVAVSFKCNHPWGAEYSWSIDDNVTVDATGVATFAVGMAKYENFTNYSLTVDGNAITLPADKEVEAGKIYNISRSVSPIISLSDRTKLDDELVIADGYIVTGSAVAYSCKVAVAAGATVTLRDVENTGYLDGDPTCPGIRCIGDATIILEGNNTVTGGGTYAGIYVPEGNTLTIRGTGSLTVTGGSGGAGIGGNSEGSCGSIVISGGTITATGGSGGAGIGLGYSSGCEFGDITISGGTVTATGSGNAPGIGGPYANFQDITITNGVTKVTVNKGSSSPYSIGTSEIDEYGYYGAITIGGTVYFNEGSFVNGGDSYLQTSPLVYQP